MSKTRKEYRRISGPEFIKAADLLKTHRDGLAKKLQSRAELAAWLTEQMAPPAPYTEMHTETMLKASGLTLGDVTSQTPRKMQAASAKALCDLAEIVALLAKSLGDDKLAESARALVG